jgi:hypothetical protein
VGHAALAVWAVLGVASAQDVTFKSSSGPTSLIELYSSEGCSSCPLAEDWVNKLKSASGLWRDIFPVVFHVDYWDGLGWPDRFASAENTQRQRHYAELLGQDSVYTPEFVVNGREWRDWRGDGKIPSGRAKNAGVLTITTHGRKISAVYDAGTAANSLTLNVAWLGFNLVTDVKRGENSGSRLAHDFVVLDWKSVPLTAGADGHFQSGPLEMKPGSVAEPGAIVVWISRGDGLIQQAVGGWLANDKRTQ